MTGAVVGVGWGVGVSSGAMGTGSVKVRSTVWVRLSMFGLNLMVSSACILPTSLPMSSLVTIQKVSSLPTKELSGGPATSFLYLPPAWVTAATLS